jgi:hypothetical protein
VGTELASPSYSDCDATPVSDSAVYVTDVGEVVYDIATPDLLRFVDTSSKIDILNYKYTFTNLSGTIVPTMNLVVFEGDSSDGPWLRSASSQDSGIIYISNAKPYVKFECTIDADIVDLNTVGILMYVEIGIHDPIPKTISDSVRNVARRFPSWTAIFEDSMDPATPALAVPESTGGKFLTALLQENLERFNSLVEINDINSYINSADESMLAWVYVSYNVPQNINLISGDSVQLARVSSFSDLLDARSSDYSFFYSAIDKQLVTLRKFETLLVNNLLYTQDPLNIYNDFDEFGARLGLPRLNLESNSNYKKRILDVTANMPGVSMEAFKRTVRRELDLWRAYGATPDSNYLGATPEVLEISDIETSTPYFTESGKPEPKFRNFVDYINNRYPSNIGYIRWNEGVWDYAGRLGEGVARIPATYDAVASPIGQYYKQGVGDFDDLALNLFGEESATTSFTGQIDISGYRKTGETNIYPPIIVEYSWYFGYLRTVSDTTSNTVGVELTYEICMPRHDNYATPSVFYANLNYNDRSDFYVTNRFLSTSNASPEYSYVNIFNNEGLTEIEFRDKIYNQLYVNSSATPATNEIDIYEAASVNVIFGRSWNSNTQSYTSLGSPEYRAAFSHATAAYYVNPSVGSSMTMNGPNIHPNDAELKIGSTKYMTKLALQSSDPVRSRVILNNSNELATPDISPKRIYTSNLINAMSIPADATAKFIYLQSATPSNLTYYNSTEVISAQGGVSYDIVSDQSYLVPSSPSLIWRSSSGNITSTPDYFDNILIDLAATPDYIELYSHYNYSVNTAPEILSDAVVWFDPALTQNSTSYMTNYGLSTGTNAQEFNAIFGSSEGSDSNDPTLLPWSGENYLYLPGAYNTYASIPDSAVLDITGDIEIVCRVSTSDWTPASNNGVFVARQTLVDPNRAWQFRHFSTGTLGFSWYPSGSSASAITATSTAAMPVANGSTAWIKVTLDIDNGAGGNTVRFYYAADQVTEPTSWTQLGADRVTAGVTSLPNVTSPLYMGWSDGTTYFEGKLYRVTVRNGIGGTTVVDTDFTTGITSGSQTSFIESSINSATVSIVRPTTGRKAVAVTRPIMLFGSNDYLAVPADPLGSYVDLSGSATEYIYTPDSEALDILGTEGTKFLALFKSVSGEYASTADAAALDITGDIDIRVRIALDDWTPTSGAYPLAKRMVTGNQRSWLLEVTSGGLLRWYWSTDGTSETYKDSTVGLSLTNGQARWIRVVFDVDNGAGGNDILFYTAADSSTEPTSWTQLGTTITTAGTTSIYSSSAPVTIGAWGDGGATQGKIYRAIIRDGIVGTTVFDANFASQTIGTTSFTESTGKTVTVTGSAAKIVDDTTFLSLGGSAYFYAYSVDNAELDITSDIEIVARVSLDDWTPSVRQSIVAKYSSSTSNRSYALTVNTTGALLFQWSTTGAAGGASEQASSVPSLSNGATYWVKVTVDADDGAGNKVITFYYAVDATVEPSSWTTISTHTTAGTLAMFSGTAALTIGAWSDGTPNNLSGKVYRTIVRNGISGTTVFDADFSRQIQFANTFTEATGKTVTLSSQGSLIGRDRDMEIIVKLASNDWTNLSGNEFVSKNFSSYDSYSFGLSPSGTYITFGRSIGTTAQEGFEVIAPSLVDGVAYWFRVTYDADDGTGTASANFYYADDSSSDNIPTVWTQIGSTSTSRRMGLLPGSSSLQVGGNGFAGKVYRTIVRNGIGGTAVADWAAYGHDASSGSYTDRYGSAWILYGGATVTNANPLNFGQSEDATILIAYRQFANVWNYAGPAGKRYTTSSTYPGWGIVQPNSARLYLESRNGGTSDDWGMTGTFALGNIIIATFVKTGTGINKTYIGSTSTQSTDSNLSWANAEPLYIGKFSSGSSYTDFELLGFAVFDRALSADDVDKINTFYSSTYDQLFYRNKNVIDGAYPFVKPIYDEFSMSSTPSIYYGFIDEVGNAHKNESEYINSFIVNDTFLSQIDLSRNTFSGIDENYTVDTVKFITDPDHVEVYVTDIDLLISNLNSTVADNSSMTIDLNAKRDDAKKNKYSIGMNSGFLFMGEKDIYVYSSPVTENYTGRLFSITLNQTPRMGSPVIVKLNGDDIREVAFEDSATPGKFSFENTEITTGNRGNSLYLAYENVSNATVTDTYTGVTLFSGLSSATNVITPFSSATPSVIGREYEVVYYVNDAFYVDKDVYNSTTDTYESKIYFSSTPSVSGSYEVTYESSRYNKSIDSELSINQLDSPVYEGFIFIDENVSPFDTIEYHLSPGYINDSGGDFMTLSIISYDQNGNFKPNQTFSISSAIVDVVSNSDLVTVNLDGSAYVTTNDNGFAAVALRYSGPYPASSRSGSITITGLNSTNPNADENSEAGSYSETITFEVIRNLSFNLQVKASPVNMVISADGITDVVIVGRVYWRDIPLRQVINLGWNKARTLRDLFQASPSNVITTDSDGYFVISGQITAEPNTNPGQWFVRVEITDSAEDIKLLLPAGEVTLAEDITISGDIVYWNEKYDNVHFANEELPLSNTFIHEKQDGADLIATPNFVYSHHNGLTVSNINATPNWTPSKWVALKRFDQYQMGLFGSTPNYISDYTQIHPDSGEE